MLRIHNINKEYTVANTKLEALKDVSLAFRKNEFVSILGPSGCGKTTLLNIIGGLDHYTSGDLFINGVSTKEFNSKDWDSYRNHKVGFVFQSYNLIPHQTILANVELSLTISGISKEIRQSKAKEALDKVGLKDLYHKKPNQLSGGQCQRVAIARALVNEPEILLADEPTGALDTSTSIQIMELIKEISKDKLVIMVTHNPDLAIKYSTRIINLLDGKVLSDSNPFTLTDEIKETRQNMKKFYSIRHKEKSKMSFWTAFKLSSKNLWSKRKRTILTCVAGSIGIIGISAVLAVSSGVKNYVSDMQDDMLSGNPITIKETAIDFASLMSVPTDTKLDLIRDPNSIYVDPILKESMQSGDGLLKNEITQDYVDYVLGLSSEDVTQVMLDYGIDVGNNIYSGFKVNTSSVEQKLSLNVIKENYTQLIKETEFKDYASYVTSLLTLFSEAPSNVDYLKSQYNILTGDVATKENEVMLVLDKDQSVADLVLAQLGFYTQEEFLQLCMNDLKDLDSYKYKFSFEDILNKTFTYYSNDQAYTKNSDPTTSSFFPFTYNANAKDITSQGVELKIVGILQPKESISYGCLSSGFYYTNELTKRIFKDSMSSLLTKYFNDNNISSLSTALVNDVFIPSEDGRNIGIPYSFEYTYNNVTKTKNSFVGSYVDYSFMGAYVSSIMGSSSSSSSSLNVSTRDLSLRAIGGVDVANDIKIYPVNFERKSNVTNYLNAWNEDKPITLPSGKVIEFANRSKIVYTDSIELIISMVNMMIDIITYALIAFTALSLVVSCVMIAIITYVSVMERVKEIGVIRSLGGRKKDVSHLFNAETFIIGSISGLFGVGITYLLSLIINLATKELINYSSIASLPWHNALIMILLSIILTVISGLIPAHGAALKDPAAALRTE